MQTGSWIRAREIFRGLLFVMRCSLPRAIKEKHYRREDKGFMYLRRRPVELCNVQAMDSS